MEKILSNDVARDIHSSWRFDFSGFEIDGDLILNINNNRSFIFKGSIFRGKVIIIVAEYGTLDFNGAEFLEGVKFEILRGNIILRSAIFKSGLDIKCKDNFSLDLSFSKLAGEIDISNTKIGEINLSNLEFISKTQSDKFIFTSNEIENTANAARSIFHNAQFNETTFKRNVTFDNSKFSYSVLPGRGNFFSCIFEADSYWNNVSFEKGCFFNGSIFRGAALFVGLNRDSDTPPIAEFSGAIFYKRAVFDNSIFSEAVFHNCEFADMASFKDTTLNNKLEISKAVFLRGSDFLNAKIKNADKETFRIIKNEFLKVNNQIEALNYRSKEMTAYENELKHKKFSSEHILLFLNRISNEYGLNWLRGVKFTFFVGLLFYAVYIFFGLNELPFRWGWVSSKSFLLSADNAFKYFIRFFIPTHDLDFMRIYNPNSFGFFIDFLARIFIGYGIYQTIQAFRKFGKN